MTDTQSPSGWHAPEALLGRFAALGWLERVGVAEGRAVLGGDEDDIVGADEFLHRGKVTVRAPISTSVIGGLRVLMHVSQSAW